MRAWTQDGEGNMGEEAGLEQWEMVVGASRLYDWHGSRLRTPSGARPGPRACHLPGVPGARHPALPCALSSMTQCRTPHACVVIVHVPFRSAAICPS